MEGEAAGTGHRVFVSNLNYRTKAEALRDHMASAGNIVNVVLFYFRDGKAVGSGVVEYDTAEAALQAISTLNESQLDDRQITVREDRDPMRPHGATRAADATGTTVFVANLPYLATWHALKDFMRTAGEVVHADVLLGQDGRSTGCGVVEYATAEAAAAAISTLSGTMFDGRAIHVREDRHVVSRSAAARVYVANLAYSTTWQQLKDHMKKAPPFPPRPPHMCLVWCGVCLCVWWVMVGAGWDGAARGHRRA